MNVVRHVVREPLIHFLLAGTAIFMLFGVLGGDLESDESRITVTQAQIARMAAQWERVRSRPPTAVELRGLVEQHVKEEIYYREAVKLGLDRNDTLIRRRMQQKMEFLSEPPESELKASDEDLAVFLKDNRQEFRVEPQIAFTQVFISLERGESHAKERAGRILARLSAAQAGAGPDDVGDPTLLPSEVSLSPLSRATRNFGDAFAKELIRQPSREWSGPVRSSYGLHLVFISERREGYDPPLGRVRDAVEKKWRTARREEYMKAEYEIHRAKYEVILPVAAEKVARQERKPR